MHTEPLAGRQEVRGGKGHGSSVRVEYLKEPDGLDRPLTKLGDSRSADIYRV